MMLFFSPSKTEINVSLGIALIFCLRQADDDILSKSVLLIDRQTSSHNLVVPRLPRNEVLVLRIIQDYILVSLGYDAQKFFDEVSVKRN